MPRFLKRRFFLFEAITLKKSVYNLRIDSTYIAFLQVRNRVGIDAVRTKKTFVVFNEVELTQLGLGFVIWLLKIISQETLTRAEKG